MREQIKFITVHGFKGSGFMVGVRGFIKYLMAYGQVNERKGNLGTVNFELLNE